MKSRVNGVLKNKAHLYCGKELLSKDEFYNWALNSNEFITLFNNYCSSGFDIKVAPSIDRIDSSKGYVIGNIRWITHSENSRLGTISRFKNKHEH
jgi:hypothetical protein